MLFSNRFSSSLVVNNISLTKKELVKQGKSIYNMSNSNPTSCGLFYPNILEAINNEEIHSYKPITKGLLSARKCISDKFNIDSDSIFLAASTSEAYSYLFKLLCDPGQSVLVPAPGYPLFDSLASLESVNAIFYRLDYSHPCDNEKDKSKYGWKFDFEDIEEKMQNPNVKAIVVINPNNPTGSFVRQSEYEQIVYLCQKYEKAIISDEVFFHYPVEEQNIKSFSLETRCLTFVLDGLSKLMCLPQMKLGWIKISGPEKLVNESKQRLEIIADAFLSAGTPVMCALPKLLTTVDDFNQKVINRLKTNLQNAHNFFSYKDSPYRILYCGGGWTVILEYPRYCDEETLVIGLLKEKNIYVQPGHFFDMEKDGYFTLSLILPENEFLDGIQKIKDYIDSMAL